MEPWTSRTSRSRLEIPLPKTTLAVITPSHGPDAPLFAELHRSVLEFTSEEVIHHVVISPAWKKIFRRFAGPRCRVWTYKDVLPRRYVRTGHWGPWVDVTRPWPPVRGWVMQQTIKLAVSAMVDADVVLIADSDAVFVRRVDPETLLAGGRARLFREDDGVRADMERHVIWHRVARELLGLPEPPPPPLHDYVTPLGIWDPAVVRAMQRRITEVTGMDWLDAFNARLHISEFMLYGVFADELLGASGDGPPPYYSTICHNHYARTPLDHESAREFAARLPEDALAIMISSHSGTLPKARQIAIDHCTRLAR